MVHSGKKGRVYPVIMAGGKGSRFWPLSRRAKPKPFLPLGGGSRTLIGETMRRARLLADPENFLIVVNEAHAQYARREARLFGRSRLLAEPAGRSTLAAITYAAFTVHEDDPEGMLVVMPADHIIDGDRAFLDAMKRAMRVAASGKRLCAIGIAPDYPATGFGYIKRSGAKAPVFRAGRFVEKPSVSVARRFLKSRSYLWNAGIFVFTASTFIEAVKRFEPSVYRAFRRAFDAHKPRERSRRLRSLYRSLENISVDCAIMERAAGSVWCVAASFGWHDAGSWVSIGQRCPRDSRGNVLEGRVGLYDSAGCIVFGEPHHLVGLCGVSDLVVIQTRDATLVCAKERAEDVKRLVEFLERDRAFKKYL